MSGSRARRRPASPAAAARGEDAQAPAPPGALVAVLERRGRFLTAEPLFPPREQPAGPRAQRGPARITLRSPGSGRGAASRAGAGDLVLLQPARGSAGARVVRVLGRPDVARDVIEALMLDRGCSRGFEQAVEREAREAAERVRRSELARRDLRELATFTIDPAGARDFDDAISAEELADGRIRVWVHIADVAAHVPEGSALDREARRRSSSVYVPGAVEPMLPHALSSEACSLAPGAQRAAVTVELVLRDAEVISAAFYRSLVRSDARLDYEQVDRMLTGAEAPDPAWRSSLQAARLAAAALARRRERSGALVLDSEEPEFTLDATGDVIDIRARVQTESHRLIEHLMIAANEAVARLLAERCVPCLYRVHERPEPARIEALVAQLASLEVPTPPLPEPLSSSQAAELLGAISRMVDQHVRRSGHGRIALSSLVLRSLKQAYYSPQNLGHAGLHSTAYCHFTSPIRRYPDIVCHRALLSAVGGGEQAPRAQDMAELGAWSSERERGAMIIERDADDVARCFALERVLYEGGPDMRFDGEITGLISAGAFVAFAEAEAERGETPSLPFEGMLPVRLLRAPAPAPAASATRARSGAQRPRGHPEAPRRGAGEREWWELSEEGTILRGERTGATLRLGDPLAVRVARVDAIRGRVDLTPAS